MPSALRSISINRPVGEDFAFVADGANATMEAEMGTLDILKRILED